MLCYSCWCIAQGFFFFFFRKIAKGGREERFLIVRGGKCLVDVWNRKARLTVYVNAPS